MRPTLTDINGTIAFRREGQSQRFVLQSQEPGIHQQFEMADGDTITERVGDVARSYKKIGEAYRLTQITGPNGVNVLITHDAAGRIIRVANDPGGSLAFQWTEGKDARLSGVVDSAGRRVTFRQDGRHLRAVIDATGAEWTYEYANGGLRNATDPMARVLLRVRYDKSGHVIEAGDALGLTRYDYEFGPGNVSRRTVVTDPMNTATIYEQASTGALTAIKDDEGRSVRVEYNGSNRPMRLVDSSGDSMTLSYDSQNRILSQSTNGAVDRAYSYGADGRPTSIVEGTERTDLTLDAGGQIVAAQSSDPARSYTATYDGRGVLTKLKSKNRDVWFEYDGRGNETAVTYSDIGRFSYERDAAGRVAATHLPSGLSFFNEFDERGAFIKQSDNRGNAVTVQRDASGVPIAYVRADGKQMRAVRDEAGRVIRETDFDGNVRSFAYNARGGLVDYTVRGKHRRFEYDHRGRLNAIVNDDGSTKRVERDERGHIRRLSYAPSARFSSFNLQAGLFRSLVDRRWAHASALQDPPFDVDGPIVTETWAPYWPGGTPGGGVHPPLQATGTDGGTGGGQIDRLDCALQVTFCFAGIMGWIEAFVAIDALCAGTLGLGCLLHLIVHPIVGAAVVYQCNAALIACHITAP